MSEPRQFWIDPVSWCDDEDEATLDAFSVKPIQGPLKFQASLIHVIEYAAYEKLKQEREILIEALEFYADKTNWDDQWVSTEDTDSQVSGGIVGGQIAREALAKIKGETK